MPRPRLYTTQEDRLAARRQQNRAADQRRRARLPGNGLQISYYQPVPPQTQVNQTNPAIGLAINNEITLPQPPRPPQGPSGREILASTSAHFTEFGFRNTAAGQEEDEGVDAEHQLGSVRILNTNLLVLY
jgi:hypothetical protein